MKNSFKYKKYSLYLFSNKKLKTIDENLKYIKQK